MIKSLQIRNYQSHKDSKFEFSNGINIIIGNSDSGKTAILRAIDLLINNKPDGIDFITHSENECQVNVETNNNIISRIKGKNNLYKLNNDEFKALGKGVVPEEIKNVINFDDLNLQKQFDNHFLLSNSSGEVARILNKIIKLDIIDNVLSKCESKKRGSKRKVEIIENEIKNFQDDLKNYDWLKQAENLINKVIILQDKYDNLMEKTKQIENLIIQLNFINKQIKKYNNLLENKDFLNKINEKVKKYNSLIEKRDNLKKLKDNFVFIKKRIKDCGLTIKEERNKLNKILKDDFICPIFEKPCKENHDVE